MSKTFELTDEQIAKVKKFHPKCKKKFKAACGKYVFEPTGIGIIEIFICPCGKELDLTNVDTW